MALKKYNIKTKHVKFINDLLTPINLYLKIRAYYANSILLETKDYSGKKHERTYICFLPIAKFQIENKNVKIQYPGEVQNSIPIKKNNNVLDYFNKFVLSFVPDSSIMERDILNNSLFGYMSYEAIQYFEDIDIKPNTSSNAIPEFCYLAFHYVLVLNHMNDELFLYQHEYAGIKPKDSLDKVLNIIRGNLFPTYPFKIKGDEQVNCTNDQFIEMVKKGKVHCQRGDVFQIVLSRCFSRGFQGDDFNVYRALRSINPSPYLFYFDFGNFKLFGSSPETQLSVEKDKALLYPIAGTFRRTGNEQLDLLKAQELLEDVKENAEHIMLVDLARNDLSIFASNVTVEKFREIQYFSYVIHLVSEVSGKIDKKDILNLIAHTFPAGTLSGAPKYKAMELIDKYEPTPRSYYGGAVGMLGFDGSFNHCIMIRSFLSKNNTLYYQAGAGVVALSEPEKELEEVNNKLRALFKAINSAEII